MYDEAHFETGGYGFETTKAVTGTSSAGKLTLAEILARDRQPVPPVLQPSGDPVPVDGLIPFERYTDPKYVDLEVEHLWKKHWQIACREEDIPNVGDRLTYDVVDLSYIIVRSAPDEIKAYHNFCPHRGRRLCDHAENLENFRCPFHAWSWDLDGSLQWVPGREDFPSVSETHHALTPVKVGRWGGNVFINPDPDAIPFEKALGPLPRLFADHPMEDRYTVAHFRKIVRCNWKLTQEAFMEGYHVLETHWDGMPFFGSAYSQYDNWDDGDSHVNRLTTPSVVPDYWVKDSISPEESAIQFCQTMGLPLPAPGSITNFTEGRAWCATQRRLALEAQSGHDLSDKPNSYFLEMTKCFLFPNHHPWWGEALAWWYRFLPVGRDPDLSVMEVRVTARIPKGQKAPLPPPMLELGPDERTDECEALGVVGHILHQDMANLVEIQKGMKAAPPEKAFLTLARYQESNIQHFHNVYRRALHLD